MVGRRLTLDKWKDQLFHYDSRKEGRMDVGRRRLEDEVAGRWGTPSGDPHFLYDIDGEDIY